ncbi:hypothetical protein Fmac_024201 [Flemingia macrophylla]|uniref:Uncharacterized protein n=1 Tax=Flemingia macrophylla TaxID=520843 RepID=A0ABD1LP91_9FABA
MEGDMVSSMSRSQNCETWRILSRHPNCDTCIQYLPSSRNVIGDTSKVESFEDDEYGGRPDKSILMSQNSRGDSESEEEFGGDESDSEDGETSDEDFRVDEDGVKIEWSSSEESDTSSYDDDDEKMVKRRERNVGSETEDDDMKIKSRTKKMQNHL